MGCNLLEDGDPHAEVVVLHGGGGVDGGQRGGNVDHKPESLEIPPICIVINKRMVN